MQVVDIIIIAIVALSALLGLKNGAFKTIVSIFTWIVALAAAYFLAPIVADALIEIDVVQSFVIGAESSIYSVISSVVPDVLLESGFVEGIFEPYLEAVESAASLGALTTSEANALMIAYALFSAIVFIAVVIVIRLIAFIIRLILDMVQQVIPVGIISRILGMIFGAVKGVLHVAIICIVFVYIIPFSTTIIDAIELSTIGEPLVEFVSEYVNQFIVSDYSSTLEKLIGYFTLA